MLILTVVAVAFCVLTIAFVSMYFLNRAVDRGDR
jgi:hypothetical protein